MITIIINKYNYNYSSNSSIVVVVIVILEEEEEYTPTNNKTERNLRVACVIIIIGNFFLFLLYHFIYCQGIKCKFYVATRRQSRLTHTTTQINRFVFRSYYYKS